MVQAMVVKFRIATMQLSSERPLADKIFNITASDILPCEEDVCQLRNDYREVISDILGEVFPFLPHNETPEDVYEEESATKSEIVSIYSRSLFIYLCMIYNEWLFNT